MSAIIENWWRFLFWNIISTWSSQYLYEILRSKFVLWNCKFSNNSQKPYLPNVLLQCMAPRVAFVHYASSSSARITTPLQYHFHHNHYSYHISNIICAFGILPASRVPIIFFCNYHHCPCCQHKMKLCGWSPEYKGSPFLPDCPYVTYDISSKLEMHKAFTNWLTPAWILIGVHDKQTQSSISSRNLVAGQRTSQQTSRRTGSWRLASRTTRRRTLTSRRPRWSTTALACSIGRRHAASRIAYWWDLHFHLNSQLSPVRTETKQRWQF